MEAQMRPKRKRFYRGPHTQNEKKVWDEHKLYVRAKRRPANLPSTYDDIRCCIQKTWKVKRQKQYRNESRGKRYEIYLSTHCCERYLADFFEEQNIPYQITYIKSGKWIWFWRRNNFYFSMRLIKYKVVYWTNKKIQLPNSIFRV